MERRPLRGRQIPGKRSHRPVPALAAAEQKTLRQGAREGCKIALK
jgi:hypothetical protein